MNKIFLGIFLSVILITSCSTPKTNDELLQEAEIQIDNNAIPEAIINLKNILQSDPEHAQARFLLGKVYVSLDNFDSAEKELIRSIKQDSSNSSAILLLAKTQLSLSQFDSVIDTLSDRHFDNVNDQIYALLLSGQAYLSTGDRDLAVVSIQEANDLSSSSQYSIFGKALLAADKNSSDEALSLLDDILKEDNLFLDAWLLKGSIHSNNKEYELAAKAYSYYFSQKPKNFGIRTLIAHNFIKAGKFSLAEPHINELIKINENHPTVNVLAAQIKYWQGEYQSAKELADRAVSTTNNGLAQMISGLSSFQLKNYEQAYYQLNAISGKLPVDHRVHKILALLQVKLGYINNLEEYLSNIESLSDDDANIYANIGMEFAQKGNKEAAIALLNKAGALAPDDALIKSKLGILKLNTLDKSGEIELKKAIELDPNFKPANIALAMNYLKNGDLNEAKLIADKWIENNPDNVTALILRGNIALKADSQNTAQEYFEQAKNISPQNIIPLFNLAVMAANKNEFERSNNYLDEIFTLDLEYPFAYRLSISNAIKLNKEQVLEKKLLSFTKKHPAAVWPRIILARRFTVQQDFDRAFNILNSLDNYHTLPNVYFQAMIFVLYSNHEFKKLDQILEKWQKAQPGNAIAYLDHIDILDKQKNYQKALDISVNALKTPSLKDNFQLKSLEAYYLLATNQIESASKKIAQLSAENSGHAFVQRLQGQLSIAQNKYDLAIQYLEKSLNQTPNQDTLLYLATSYKLNNQLGKALELLEEQKKKTPKNKALNLLLNEIYISENPSLALKRYIDLLEQQPNDIASLNNIAWIYYEKADYSNAHF